MGAHLNWAYVVLAEGPLSRDGEQLPTLFHNEPGRGGAACAAKIKSGAARGSGD